MEAGPEHPGIDVGAALVFGAPGVVQADPRRGGRGTAVVDLVAGDRTAQGCSVAGPRDLVGFEVRRGREVAEAVDGSRSALDVVVDGTAEHLVPAADAQHRGRPDPRLQGV